MNLDGEKIELIINGWNYNFSRSGNFGVEARKESPGDVNGDSRVDIFDLLSLLKVLGGQETGQDRLEAADVNQDSRADIFDLLGAIEIVERRFSHGKFSIFCPQLVNIALTRCQCIPCKRCEL